MSLLGHGIFRGWGGSNVSPVPVAWDMPILAAVQTDVGTPPSDLEFGGPFLPGVPLMEEHLNELEAYTDIQDFHDLCNLGNIGTGRAQPELICEAACRDARRLGVECEEPDADITPKEAMNFIADLIARIERHNKSLDALTSDLKEWTKLKEKPLLTPPEVAKLCGVNPEKVGLWIDDPVDPLLAINVAKDKNGKKPRWKIRREELDKWLARREAMSKRDR